MICIDPGHGGKDSGAAREGIKEKDIALHIAKIASHLIFKSSILTRNSDTFLSPERRVRIANQSRAKFFISIHCNSVKKPRAKGFETWYCKGSKIGKHLANLFQERLCIWGSADRGVKEAYGKDKKRIFVLKYTKMPAVLLELGFLSNPFDRRKLIYPEWQRIIAKEIAELVDLLTPC